MLAAVPDNAGLCRFICGDFVGDATVDLELWDFCGDAERREMPALTLARGLRWATLDRRRAFLSEMTSSSL